MGDDWMLHSIQPEKEVQDAQLSDAQEIDNATDCMHDHNTINPVQDFGTSEEHQRKEYDTEESLSDFESERGQQTKTLESKEEQLNIQSTEIARDIRIMSKFWGDS